ncbi:hypothetical protein LINPERHAP2_LOCUS40412 [Linum perenne]
MVPKMSSCDGLLFFDGHGRIEGREALTMLAKHLRQLHLLVNPEGYCFQEVSEFGVYSDFGIHYVRLNDLFSWPRHKVDLATTNVWSRLELKYSLPKHKNTSQPPTVGGGVSKEKYAELEKSVKEKDDELEKLKEEMDGASEAREKELQNLKKENEEQQKKAQKKDKELQMLKKKKVEEEEAKAQRIEQLEKLNEDLEEANKVKDEELQKLAKSNNIGELQKQLKKKGDELQMLKKKKDEEEMTKLQRIEELEKVNEDLEEANKVKDEELQKLAKSNNIEKLQKQLKRKDDELQTLKKKKVEEEATKTQRIEELEKVNEELEETNRVKDEESQKLVKLNDIRELQKQLKKKDDELWLLKKKDSEEATAIRAKDEELSKLKESDNELRNLLKMKDNEKNEELEKLRKEKNEEMQKLLKEKSKELEVLEKKKEMEKNDEATKTRNMEGELKEARDKLSSSVAQMKKELEECRRNSWAILPSTKFLPHSLDAKDKYLAMRQPVPPGTFISYSRVSFPYVSNSPKLVDRMRVAASYVVMLVEEESSPAEWPPIPTVTVFIGRGNEDFDKNNWWYLKTTHPDGGLTMLIFYDGNRSQISIERYDSYDTFIPLPFSKDLEVYSCTHTFSIFKLNPFGVKFGFAYRPK